MFVLKLVVAGDLVIDGWEVPCLVKTFEAERTRYVRKVP